jgi:hypothetical protein
MGREGGRGRGERCSFIANSSLVYRLARADSFVRVVGIPVCCYA